MVFEFTLVILESIGFFINSMIWLGSVNARWSGAGDKVSITKVYILGRPISFSMSRN